MPLPSPLDLIGIPTDEHREDDARSRGGDGGEVHLLLHQCLYRHLQVDGRGREDGARAVRGRARAAAVHCVHRRDGLAPVRPIERRARELEADQDGVSGSVRRP
eukprot:4530138-Pyramimonas_sp.AAC.1